MAKVKPLILKEICNPQSLYISLEMHSLSPLILMLYKCILLNFYNSGALEMWDFFFFDSLDKPNQVPLYVVSS